MGLFGMALCLVGIGVAARALLACYAQGLPLSQLYDKYLTNGNAMLLILAGLALIVGAILLLVGRRRTAADLRCLCSRAASC